MGWKSRVSGVLVEYIASDATREDEIIDVAALGIYNWTLTPLTWLALASLFTISSLLGNHLHASPY